MALFQLHFFSQNLLTTHNIFFLKKYKHVHPSWSHNIVAKFVLNTKTNTCWSLVCYKYYTTSSMVSSALPSPSQFSALDTNSATDTLCSTLTSCLDNFCPLSSRPARATPSAPWLSDVLREHRTKLRAAERKWHKSKNSTDLSVYQSHLSSFSANVSTAKMTYYHNKINNCSDSRALFKTFSSLLCPPPPPPSSTLTADDFATFFTNKTKTISDQFLTPQTNNNFIMTNTQSLTSFSPLSETEVSKLILSNHPTTCPLDPIPTHLLQAISSSVIPALTHIINTSLHTGTFPTAFKQARVSPLLKNLL